MLVFWQYGYDRASLTDLTTAMGIAGTSMYAAFGSKEELFRKALVRYTDAFTQYEARALAEPTAREVAANLLNGTVQATTAPGHPTGCFAVQSSLIAGNPGRDILAAWHDVGWGRLRDRFRRAIDEGDLPPETDPGVLARYLKTVANGLAVQAAGGACRAELQQVADATLRSWPGPAER
ncbi:TetR/AcrR family transcriptional regulator [Actinoplanes sp. NPDC049265]|uniref:TetR/AcrR family transcriptional regulator n=1 Tax=Actinoplanes sp. NPDC049265 TaxID=3363902 RepID=UPI0037247344